MSIQIKQEDIGGRLKTARLQNNLSQAEIAKEFGRTRQAVAAWESGESSPTALQLARLCIIYGCSADSILFDLKTYELDHEVGQYLDELPEEVRGKVKMLWSIFRRPRETVKR